MAAPITRLVECGRAALMLWTQLVLLAAPAAGQAARPPADTADLWRRVLMWVLLLIIAAVVLVVLAMWFRRQILGGQGRNPPQPGGWTLGDLRRLRSEGKISQQEYEQTRDRIVQAAQSAIADAADEDRPAVDAPRTKDVDLIRDAER